MDIGDILSNLSESDMENLRSAAQSIFGGQGTEGGNENPGEEKNESRQGGEAPDLFSLLGDPELVSALGTVLGAMNRQSAKGALFESLKPLLSEGRRKKAEDAARIMRLLDILPLITGLSGGGREPEGR